MSRRTPRTRAGSKTDAQLLKELEDLGRRVHETAETVRDGGRRSAGTLLGRQFPMPGLDDARRLLLDQMRDGACILSTEGNIIACNRAFAHMLDRTTERVVGTPLGPHLRASDRPVLRSLMDSPTRVARAEVSLVRPDRSERRVALLSLRTLLYGFKAHCLVTRDLTEERKLSDIVGSDEMARIVFEQAREAIVVCDADGKILRANHRAAEMAVESPDLKNIHEAFGLTGLATTVDGEQVPDGVFAWLKEGGRKPLEARMEMADGGAVHLLLNAGPIHNSSGEFLGWVVSLTNITARVDAERDMRRAAERERALNLSLKIQAEELQQKNRELEQFALTASHDLQEPLRKINSFGELLQQSFPNLDDRSRDYLDRIKRAANRMALLIEDLLQYARASGEKEAFSKIDAAAVVREALSQIDVHVEKSGVKVEVGPLPEVWAIRGQLQQIFVNLIGNAIKYRGKVDPWVKIYAEREAAGWRFIVEDNGIGIEPQYSERIFRIFERLHSRNQYLGTGIGLAICKKIAERHGGRIWVESEPGKGSKFILTLPDETAWSAAQLDQGRADGIVDERTGTNL